MKKRFFAVLLVMVFAVSLAVPSLAAASAKDAFLSMNGQDIDGWYFVGRLNGGDWQELHAYDWGDGNPNFQFSAEPNDSNGYYGICKWEKDIVVQAGTNGNGEHEIGVAYEAAADGKIVIADFDVINFGWNGIDDDAADPCEVIIAHGTTELARSQIGYTGTATGAEVTVAKGDRVYIYVAQGNNVVLDNLGLVFEEASAPVTDDSANQTDNGVTDTGETGNKENVTNPQTGDSSLVILAAGALLLASCAFVLVNRKVKA